MTITRHTPLNELPKLLRVEEAATYLGTSKGLIYELAKRGQLPSVKLGRLLRIRREGLSHVGEGASMPQPEQQLPVEIRAELGDSR